MVQGDKITHRAEKISKGCPDGATEVTKSEETQLRGGGDTKGENREKHLWMLVWMMRSDASTEKSSVCASLLRICAAMSRSDGSLWQAKEKTCQ